MFLAFTAVMEVVCVQQQPAPPPLSCYCLSVTFLSIIAVALWDRLPVCCHPHPPFSLSLLMLCHG
ncbi:hypothetical protein ERO13_D12G243650v2 [Gossypium hirsutum]|uniref:Uncharacterized protein n=2 Tax=Gossypium TaxID=3633 RepID=A0A5J5P380_GOSBA|nr:hypothetical protein ES319_D12G268800v1 [Gossypium barbadense]KAG4117628.1 hypothetical protein ERO13_D12G243650v2 [Gossypium hirsutum]TYG42766.1 hypothetical protein ES288_D12G284000v1 [Gossypium darwinii]